MTYLDDRPVDQGERLAAKAFFEGGIEAEKKARTEWLRNKNMSLKVHEQEQRNQVLFEERKKKSLDSLNTEYSHRKNYLEDRMRQITREMINNPENIGTFEIHKKSIEFQIEENEKMKIYEEKDIMKTCSKRENFDKFAVFEYEDWMDDVFEKRVVENFFDFGRAVRLIKLDLQMRNVKNWEMFNDLDLRIRWTELEIKKFKIENSSDIIDERILKSNETFPNSSTNLRENENKFESFEKISADDYKCYEKTDNQKKFPKEEFVNTFTITDTKTYSNPGNKITFDDLD